VSAARWDPFNVFQQNLNLHRTCRRRQIYFCNTPGAEHRECRSRCNARRNRHLPRGCQRNTSHQALRHLQLARAGRTFHGTIRAHRDCRPVLVPVEDSQPRGLTATGILSPVASSCSRKIQRALGKWRATLALRAVETAFEDLRCVGSSVNHRNSKFYSSVSRMVR
jgi:hypothetical protein